MFNESQIISFDEIHCNNKEQVFFSILAIDLVASKKTRKKRRKIRRYNQSVVPMGFIVSEETAN